MNYCGYHYGYKVKKITHNDFKEGEIYICDNSKETFISSVNMEKEVTLCKCMQVDVSTAGFTEFVDFKLLEGETHYGKDEKLAEWLYQTSDDELYDFYLVSKEEHPEEFL